MTWEQITQLHKDGFEIGNHTLDHRSVTRDGLRDLAAQVRGINARCKEHGIPVPVSFAYPGNAIERGALPVLRDLGIRFARRGGSPEHPYKDGRGFAGIVASETGNGIALKRQEGQTDVILRADLDELRTAGQSLMPEGWTELDWYRWLFLFSPYAISLQFVIGVAAYWISLLPLPGGVARLLSNAGAVGLLAVYVRDATGVVPLGAFMVGMYAALATGLLMAGASSDSITNRLLSGRAIVYVGTISYSLYLFHYLTPPIALHGRQFDSFTPTAAGFHAINFAASLALAIIFSTGVYTLVEVPGRRWIRAMADQLLGLRRAPGRGTRDA